MNSIIKKELRNIFYYVYERRLKTMNPKTLKVITENCPQNHFCPSVLVCPVEALKQERYKAPTVDPEICIQCGKCTNFCPRKALVLV
jgi:Fe-S-cluster-containing hydrogenase component 2